MKTVVVKVLRSALSTKLEAFQNTCLPIEYTELVHIHLRLAAYILGSVHLFYMILRYKIVLNLNLNSVVVVAVVRRATVDSSVMVLMTVRAVWMPS